MNKHLIIHRICKLLHYNHYYENAYGIKVHNKNTIKINESNNVLLLNPDSIRLGFDGLKDQYTLLGTSISSSPHIELMRRLLAGDSICDCEYVNKEKTGTLDGRYELPVPDHEQAFKRAMNSIITETYDPAHIYSVGDDWYVFDGKHRLALCCALGLKCKCNIINIQVFQTDDHTLRLYHEMKKRNSYSRNVNFLKSIIEPY